MSEVKISFTGYITVDGEEEEAIAQAIEKARADYGNEFADFADFTIEEGESK